MEQTLLRHYTIDKLVIYYETVSNVLLGRHRRKELTNTDFTIISNNCWGGHVYRRYDLPYLSPTVGLYFYAEEYIRFLSNLEANLHAPLKFIPVSESKYAPDLMSKKRSDMPIGLLNDDIEIVFLHYKNEQEAYEKWNRRAERVNMRNLIVKFSQMNFCTDEHLRIFCGMEFPKTVLFLASPLSGITNGTVIERYTRQYPHGLQVSDDTTYYSRYIDLNKLINF